MRELDTVDTSAETVCGDEPGSSFRKEGEQYLHTKITRCRTTFDYLEVYRTAYTLSLDIIAVSAIVGAADNACTFDEIDAVLGTLNTWPVIMPEQGVRMLGDDLIRRIELQAKTPDERRHCYRHYLHNVPTIVDHDQNGSSNGVCPEETGS